MLRSYGAFLFLPLIIPGLTARDSIDDFSFWGGFFFVLNQPAPVGADEINIPPAAAGDKYITLPLPREG